MQMPTAGDGWAAWAFCPPRFCRNEKEDRNKNRQSITICPPSLALGKFQSTPFENAHRWMGKNTFHFLLLNDDNMIGEH